MLVNAAAGPANRIATRIGPVSVSQARTRVALPVSSHSRRWKARSASTRSLIEPSAAREASSARLQLGEQQRHGRAGY